MPRNLGRASFLASELADGSDQFCAFVGDEPAINTASGFCPWTAVDHDSAARVLDE
jgi:hypothetical protein